GYWTIGSQNYQPQEMATFSMFNLRPMEVWKWYIYRHKVCNQVAPNAGHYALVEMENILKDRFSLITQNVDGLHKRAGNSVQRTFCIHGNLEFCRCSHECTETLYPFPKINPDRDKEADLSETDLKKLYCPRCNELLRPHILWFDERYNENYYKLQSSLALAKQSDILFLIGTSGITNLPYHVMKNAGDANSYIVEINPAETNFTSSVAAYEKGFIVREPSSTVLPKFLEAFKKVM
ncbi:sigma factor, partial [Achromatium sp. WMS3]